MNNPFSRYWPWFFFAAAFQSLFAVAALLFVPSESGLSFARLGLLGILFLCFFAGIYLGFDARRNVARYDRFASAIFLPAALFPASAIILFLLRYLDPERLLSYYERLGPLLWYLLAVSLQALVFFLLVKCGFFPRALSKRKAVYVFVFYAFCALALVFVFVAVTKIGVTPDKAYWGEPGVAILGWQFVAAIFIGMLVLLFQLRASNDRFVANYLYPLLIYLSAVLLWLSVPLEVLRNSFYAPIVPPLDIPLPYSDAGFYDYLSQSLLIGSGYLERIPPRPLYVVFLAVLHFFFGQNYPAVIAAQTCVLALFPVALYFLGKKLRSPAAGVIAALFAVFRELVGLWISSDARVANSKMFTTDFPAAMALAFLCLVFVWWLERRDLKATLFAGGCFGLTLLFRTQSLFVLPVVFALAWFAYQRRTKDWLVAAVVFAIPMVLTVAPWLTHNYQLVGKIAFDDPNQMAILYSQYSFNETFNLQEFDIQSKSLGARMLEFTLDNPAYVATFWTSHFLNTEIGGLLSLPLIERFDGLSAPVNIYWVAWDGTLAWYNLALLIVYLAIIAVGFGSAWQRARWLGLLPLAVNIGYALSNAVSRFSSWRYNMPVDWVVYFYFAIGIVEILGWIALLFGANADQTFPQTDAPKAGFIVWRDFSPKYALFLCAFVFIGALPWLAKGLAAPRYVSTREEMLARLESRGYAEEEIRAFLSQPAGMILEGRMLYPRMYRRDEGVGSANPWAAYRVRDYPRVGFVLLNQKYYDAIFPVKDLPDFRQGADVTLLACQKEDHIEVRAIVFDDQSFHGASLAQPCQ